MSKVERHYCHACGTAWLNHSGIENTCRELLDTREELDRLRSLLDQVLDRNGEERIDLNGRTVGFRTKPKPRKRKETT